MFITLVFIKLVLIKVMFRKQASEIRFKYRRRGRRER